MKNIIIILFMCVIAAGFMHAQEQDLPIITVMDFKTESISQNEMKAIISLLSSEIFKTGEFTVIDVSEREQLLKELEFSLSGCVDDSCMLEAGKMLSAEMIVTGSIELVGSRYVISLKLLETETARTVKTADGKFDDMDHIIDNVPYLAKELAGLENKGVKKPSKNVFFALGTDPGVSFPFGTSSFIFGPYNLFVPVSFNLNFRFMPIEFGFGASVSYFGLDNLSTSYSMFSIGACAEALFKYYVAGNFYIDAAVSAGVLVNVIKSQSAEVQDMVTAKFMLLPAAGIGYSLTDSMNVSIDYRFTYVAFNDHPYTGSTVTAGISFKL